MKIAAVILGLLGAVAILTGVSLIRDYAAYDQALEGEVVQVSGREVIVQLSETNAQGVPWQLPYGRISGTGMNDVPADQPVPKLGDKINLVSPLDDAEKARLPDSISIAPAVWSIVIGLVLVTTAAGLFIAALKLRKSRPEPAAKPKRAAPQRLGI